MYRKILRVAFIIIQDVVSNRSCIEINFYLERDEQYTDCWLGKMPQNRNTGEEVFWYGLTEDGKKAYDFNSADEFLHAKVFDGKDLLEVLHKVIWKTFDGCDFKEMWNYYKKR